MFTSPGDRSMALADRLRLAITDHSNNAPRSRQSRIGLSEVGEVCVRKLAYKMVEQKKTNPQSDPWASISGTALHTWLADCFGTNSNYLVEHKVEAAPGLMGTLDLFDIAEGMVIDHKCVGASSMKARKKDGLTQQQRIQISLYAKGLENQGHTVTKVACAFYPLGGRLDGLHTIVEDYDSALADAAIERFEATRSIIHALDPANNPMNWLQIPATQTYSCIYCPWYLPGSADLSMGCPGEAA